jgi:hypothetical protein
MAIKYSSQIIATVLLHLFGEPYGRCHHELYMDVRTILTGLLKIVTYYHVIWLY